VTRGAWIAAAVLLAACGGSPGAAQATPTRQTPGPLGDTWTGDGAVWHRAAGAGPTARYQAALAYDSKHNVFVLFGGQTSKGTSDDTWTWDGKGGHIPDQAEGYDANDTWTWDGSDWVQVDTGPGPPPERQGLSLITAGDRIILFGGRHINAVYFGDAWSWDGKRWSRIDVPPRPPGRGTAAVAWDPVDSSLFVFGGSGFNATAGPGAQGTPLSDGWTLTRGVWTQLNGFGPGRLAYANAMWDRAGTRVVVLLGMRCPDPSNAAWAWDGKAWSQLANTPIPPRWGATVAQGTDGKALLFGGSNAAGC